MDTSKLKKYAPQARKDFIAAVTNQAATYGLTAKKIEPVDQKGDTAIIGSRVFPKSVASKRKRLEDRIQREGFGQVMEAIAYTWFNRLVALRYMELHGYLDHGYRVLSHPEGGSTPEIVEHAEQLDLPGLDKGAVIDLKLDATKESELYRLLLVAQCNALNSAMPFLFERIDDETELLLPENLLHSDSVIRKLVNEISEEQWAQIEIIGWIYQFYISEKKDEVIGKVVRSEDIPAATQLFTPNWIVKYLVQNSLGAQWLATYPDSPLKKQMEYYIQPAEQTPEVQAQLDEITPKELNPEELTLMDPACGSGHILVEAYDLLKAIYLERGYRAKDIPQLILEKNLFGLEIDARAAQLASLALMMKARADDRRLFERDAPLNVMAFVNSTGLGAEPLEEGDRLAKCGLRASDLLELERLFEHATTFGSLLAVPSELGVKLPAFRELGAGASDDLFSADALKRLRPLVRQATLLQGRYDAVVANPPYMGTKYMPPPVNRFAKDNFPDANKDLFACFIERGYSLARDGGYNAMVTMESWMFLSSYEKFREKLLSLHTLRNLAHFPYDGKKPTVMGINFGIAAFCGQNAQVAGYQGHFCCSRYYELDDDGLPLEFPTLNERLKTAGASDLRRIPGSPIAYWVSEQVRNVFSVCRPLGEVCIARQGLATSDNDRFVRCWFEVGAESFSDRCASREDARTSGKKWFPFNKGGPFRRWYGNLTHVVDWEDDGEALLAYARGLYGSPTRTIKNIPYYFKEGITWSDVTSGGTSMRYLPPGCILSNVGHSAFFQAHGELKNALAYLNSPILQELVHALSPTLHFDVGYFNRLPALQAREPDLIDRVHGAIEAAKRDWDAYERSWAFRALPILKASSDPHSTLECSYAAWITQNRSSVSDLKRLEEENNRLFIDAYGLQAELSPEVPIDQITLTVNPAYRYGGELSGEEQWTRFREDTMQELVSYAVGCMMGRYSLDEPGLIYAHSGNEGFDPKRYRQFPADDDGIVPLTDLEWFDDDACNRIVNFISTTWEAGHLEENLTFLAENLSPKKKESSRETIRRYLCDHFFKDHLQTYKKRPIYWLFSSGKEKAFQALVYLHRYNEGTLARMRTEYVVPLQGMVSSRIEQLEGDVAGATSTSHRRKLEKEREALVKQQAELQEFDEKLRHYADQRISLDLDDGVKVNYGKFGDLLAEVKAVTGKKPS